MKQRHKTRNIRNRSWWPVIIGMAVIGLCGASVAYYFYNTVRKPNDATIVQHIEQLSLIFTKINETCKIKGFQHIHDPIDFLNTISFVGSHVGPMELLYPNNWQGPYSKDEFKTDNKPYEVVSTTKGYFIVPGAGVKLANGKVIGKDIKLTQQTDIAALMKDPQGLMSSDGKPLAAQIPIHNNPFDLLMSSPAAQEELDQSDAEEAY